MVCGAESVGWVIHVCRCARSVHCVQTCVVCILGVVCMVVLWRHNMLVNMLVKCVHVFRCMLWVCAFCVHVACVSAV